MRAAGFPAQVLFSKHTAATVPEALILNSRTHPLRPKLLEKLASAPSDVLRWEFVTATSIKALPKTVLRTTLKGQWDTAFRAALLRHGYGTDGESLASTMPRQGLAGRLEIIITQAQGMNTGSEELVAQCSRLVTALEGIAAQERRHSTGSVVRRVGASHP